MIPEGYRKIAETYDKFKQTTVSCYYNADIATYYIKVGETLTIGPIRRNELEVLQNVMRDVIDKTGIAYLE